MIAWLYRYVFRGIGILFAIGMITILVLTLASEMRQKPHPQPAKVLRTAS